MCASYSAPFVCRLEEGLRWKLPYTTCHRIGRLYSGTLKEKEKVRKRLVVVKVRFVLAAIVHSRKFLRAKRRMAANFSFTRGRFFPHFFAHLERRGRGEQSRDLQFGLDPPPLPLPPPPLTPQGEWPSKSEEEGSHQPLFPFHRREEE